MSVVTRAAVLMVTAALSGAIAQGVPPRFEAFCGYPFGETVDWRYPTEFRSYYERLTNPSDERVDPLVGACPPEPQTAWLESALHESMTWYLGLGFDDPGPELVGPMVRAQGVYIGPPDRMRVYLNDRPYLARNDAAAPIRRSNAHILGSPCVDGRIVPSLPFLTAGVTKLRRSDQVLTTMVGAHEIFHVVQRGQPLWLSLATCDVVPLWVLEGTTQALAAAFVRTKWPAVEPRLRDPDMLMGLRTYRRRSLVDDDAPRNRLPYYTSSFWSWLAERYGSGSSREGRYGFLAEVMSQPMLDPAAPDWLAWLDHGLSTRTTWGIEKSLTLLFPSFLASYADWGTSRWPHVGDNAWRGFAFGGCEFVGLSVAEPTVTLSVSDVPSLGGRCVIVRVSDVGIAANQPVWYSVRTTGDKADDVEDLHLAFVERGGRVDKGVATRCHEEEQRLVDSGRRDVVACLIDTVTAAQDGEKAMRAWVAEKRHGGDWRDVVVLARAPLGLTDRLQAGLTPRSYDVVFSLESATMTIDGKRTGGTMGGANWRAPGVTRMPILAAEGISGSEGLDPSRLMFGQQAPGAVPFGVAGPPGGGLFTVQAVEGADGEDDDIGLGFAFWPRGDGIPYGATGVFDGWFILGVDGTRSGTSQVATLSSTGPTAVITVHGWDADHVHLTASGAWCYDDERRIDPAGDRTGCLLDRRVDAEMWLAFGDTYDADRPYVSLDTPVQALYREAFAQAAGFGRGFPVPADADGASPSVGAADVGGGGGGETFACACTCAGLVELERTAESLEDAGDMELVATITQCALRCMVEFARCED